MSDAPEQIFAEPAMPGYTCEKSDLYTVEYIRADIVARMVNLGHQTYKYHKLEVERKTPSDND